MADPRNYRVFWRILFDVRGGTARLRKELTLWYKTGQLMHLLKKEVIPLTFWASDEALVTINSNEVVFNGGYYICEDSALTKNYIQNLFGVTLDPDGISRANLAENIAVWAEVSLTNGDGPFPLFYYPQHTSGSYLALSVIEDASNNRSIHWKIANETHQSDSYTIEGNHWHRVRVRENISGNRFEFLVDSVPLGVPPTIGTFQFSQIDREFYIGRAPDPSNPTGWLNLQGGLQQLEFDPNDSCTSCRG